MQFQPWWEESRYCRVSQERVPQLLVLRVTCGLPRGSGREQIQQVADALIIIG